MLKDHNTYSSIPVSDITKTKSFYAETLGLVVLRDTEGGVMYFGEGALGAGEIPALGGTWAVVQPPKDLECFLKERARRR